MRVLITGARGQLGTDLVEAAGRAGHDVVACGRDELDVRDEAAVDRLVEAERPDAVFNCAAYTDVDGAEADEDAAMAINAGGAAHVARAATRTGAMLVHVSSDYVFDGRRREPYLEHDEPAPLSAYGRSKLAGEREVAATGPGHAIVRSSWLFGRGGANFVETMLRLGSERDEVGVVSDQEGCPTWTGHLAPALVDIAERELGGLRHVAASGHCSWHAFAQEIFRQAGLPCSVTERTTAELGRPAPRPAYSVLSSAQAHTPQLPPWPQGLAAYLAERSRAVAADPATARPA